MTHKVKYAGGRACTLRPAVTCVYIFVVQPMFSGITL